MLFRSLKFLREKDNFKYLNNHTKKEIEIGIDLLSADVKKEDIVKTICEITDEVLSQDDSWLTFYQNGMSKKSDNPIQNKKDSLEIKEIERDAIQLFNKGRYEEAISLVDNILNNKKITDEERTIYLTYYDSDNEGQVTEEVKKVQWLDPVPDALKGKNVLVVDEVDDSRVTMEFCLTELQKEDFGTIGVAVLHEKIKAKVGKIPEGIPYFSGLTVEDWWINYPWDALDIDEHNRLAAEGKK